MQQRGSSLGASQVVWKRTSWYSQWGRQLGKVLHWTCCLGTERDCWVAWWLFRRPQTGNYRVSRTDTLERADFGCLGAWLTECLGRQSRRARKCQKDWGMESPPAARLTPVVSLEPPLAESTQFPQLLLMWLTLDLSPASLPFLGHDPGTQCLSWSERPIIKPPLYYQLCFHANHSPIWATLKKTDFTPDKARTGSFPA